MCEHSGIFCFLISKILIMLYLTTEFFVFFAKNSNKISIILKSARKLASLLVFFQNHYKCWEISTSGNTASRGRNIETFSSQTRFFLSKKNWIVRMTECMHGATMKPGRRCHRSNVCTNPHLWWFGWGVISWRYIHFCEHGVKTDKKVYQRMVEEIVEPLQDTLFEWSNYRF